jgi:hypothetical protein
MESGGSLLMDVGCHVIDRTDFYAKVQLLISTILLSRREIKTSQRL